MRYVSVMIAALIAVSVLSPICASAEDAPTVSAKAAIVVSADTGEVVFAENSEEKLPMASTTKIMSTLLCIESGDLYTPFVVDSDAIRVEGSSMGLQEGDTVTKYALCCGMMLPSGNDAANAAAVRVSGSIEAFAELMNQRARKMGLSRTFFVTPSGLEGEGHGSSAHDMAVLTMEALRNETFREICSSETMKLEFGAPPYTRWLKNTNKLLTLYSGTYGVKTGFTDEAGRCLVSACRRDDKSLICVTLNDRNDWNDHMALYDYCFEQVSPYRLDIPQDMSVELAGAERDRLAVSCDEQIMTMLSASPDELEYIVVSSPFVYAPVSIGDEVGELIIRLNGRELRRTALYAAEDAEVYIPEIKDKESFFDKLFGFVKKLFS